MTDPMELDRVVIDRLTANTEPWLSCDDCFEQVDVAIEELLTSASPFSEPFRVHLLACGVCHEEADSLAAMVAADYGMTGSEAVARLEAALLEPSR
ncbi:MAG TPA: hypothetical protein PLT68_13480 [Actinomycetota bacterium]|nr:hypothetical protein [Actinomycetota bacterium]